MQKVLGDFVRALRAHDVEVSPAEAIDAAQVMQAVGFDDRSLLRDGLCVALAKSERDVVRFEACFDAFFERTPPSRPSQPSENDSLLTDDDPAALAAAMEAAAEAIGAGEIRITTQRNLMTRRLLDEMGLRALEGRISQLERDGDAEGAQQLRDRRGRLFTEAGEFVDRQARLYASETGRRLREQVLARQSFASITADELSDMTALVRSMAKRLASRHRRRRRMSKTGKLDARTTLRRSIATDGVPFELHWKHEKIDRPKILAICDVSRSVANAARFLLMFLYCLNEVVERFDAFAFSDRAVLVNDLLEGDGADDSIHRILSRVGFKPTDYGAALADVMDEAGSRIDHRTTVIVLGDGRSNHTDPRLDLARILAERARAVIWLNPEPTTYWDQGDSRMSDYRRFCTVAAQCATLADLERLIEDALRRYLPR